MGSIQQPPPCLLDLPDDLLLKVVEEVTCNSREAFCIQRLICTRTNRLANSLAHSFEVTDAMLVPDYEALYEMPAKLSSSAVLSLDGARLAHIFPKLEKLVWGTFAAPAQQPESFARQAFLTQVVSQLTGLRTLDLLCSRRDWWQTEDPALCTGMDWDVGFTHSVSSEHLQLVAECCPHLTSLSCSISAMSCLHPLSALSSLAYLRATGAMTENPLDAAKLLLLPSLSSLYLDCPGIHSLSWTMNLTQLTALSLLVGIRHVELRGPTSDGLLVRTSRLGSSQFNEQQCVQLLESLKSLRVFVLNTDHPLGSRALDRLGRLSHLEKLFLHCPFDLDSTSGLDDSPRACASSHRYRAAAFSKLQTLHIERAWDLSPAVLCALGLAAPLPNLRRLLLTDCYLVGMRAMLSLVASQTALHELLLNDCGFSDPADSNSRAALLELSRLTGLTTLHVDLTCESHDINASLSSLLATLPNLRTFGLRSSTREVGPRGRSPSCIFPVLASMPRLQNLSFHYMVAPELDFAPLPLHAFSSLRSVQLTFCMDQVAATLAALGTGSGLLPHLCQLSVTQSRIKFPEALLELVSRELSLRRVELEEFQNVVTESALLQLTTLSKLEHLALLGPGLVHLTSEQVGKLRTALPVIQELHTSRAC